jgi:hypothetical protein
MAKRKKTEASPLKPKSIKPMAVNMPKVTDTLSTGKMLENVNVRPSRWQTAKYDANVFNTSNDPYKTPGKTTREKIENTVSKVIRNAAGFTTGLPLVGFNVISGQARYNKNKRAGLEKGISDFKVRNSSTPLAPTEFNED